ncbi:DUF5711 family protein [Clostridiaceae bacterium OttesenSCG-928-D20]|nr:DUF5711 family protein [Clostridiaceae bacterium OttesenSCG-928-D20]
MSEKENKELNEVKTEKKERGSGARRHILALLTTVLIIVLAVLIFLYRDVLSPSRIINAIERKKALTEDSFSFETGIDAMFSPVGNGLAVVSSSGFKLIDADGKTVSKEIIPLSRPSIQSSPREAAFFDIGGKTLRIARLDGEVIDFDRGSEIISVSMNNSSYLSVITGEPSYKGQVTVFDAELSPIYKWYSGVNYPINSEVSPDNTRLAVLTLGKEGGAVTVFSFDNEEPLASFSSPGELFIDLKYINKTTLCLISETRLLFLDESLSIKASFDFSTEHLGQYSLDSDGCVFLYLRRYQTGDIGRIICIGQEGEILSEIESDKQVLSMQSNSIGALVHFADELVLYNTTLSVIGANSEKIKGIGSVVLRPKGDALLISAFYAEVLKF